MATSKQIKEFIEKIAPYVVKHAKTYGCKYPSAVIAQACYESAYGTSSKAKQHHNYFGLKYRKNRVKCHSGYFKDGSKEEYQKGVFTPISTYWYAFANMDKGVEGYFQFVNIDLYKSIKSATSPKNYLERLQKIGYSTYRSYAKDTYSIVQKYKLTKYDNTTTKTTETTTKETNTTTKTTKKVPMIFLDAGHGGKDSGATYGKRKESDDVLKLVLAIGKKLKAAGYTVKYSRTTDIYETPTKKAEDANKVGADYFFSFHRNSFNGKAKGYETLYYSTSAKKDAIRKAVGKKMSDIGFSFRGDKKRTDLTVLRKSKAPALLFEVGFIDSPADNKIFDAKFDNIVSAFVSVIKAQIPIKVGSSTPKPLNEQYEAHMASYSDYIKSHSKYFYRSWDAHEDTFAKAKAKVSAGKKTGLTCVVPVRWGLRAMGIDPSGFQGKDGKFVGFDADMKAKLTKYTEGKFIGHTVKYCVDNGLLKPGDILCFKDYTHTTVYSGKGYGCYDAGSAAEQREYKTGILLDYSVVCAKKLIGEVLRWK